VLGACLVILLVVYGIFYSYGVFFKSIESEFGWGRTETSGVFSLYWAFGCFLGVLSGWALDRYGARVVVTIMGFFTGLSLLLTSQVSTPWHLFVSYGLLLAIGTAGGWTITIAIVSRWFAKMRGLAIGIVTSGVGLSIMIMTPISAYLIASYGWHNSYAILGFIALCTIIPCGLLIKKAPGEIAALPGSEKLDVTKLSVTEKQPSTEPKDFSLLQATKTRNFWLFFSIQFLFAFFFHLLMIHIVPHAIDSGIALLQAPLILSLLGVMTILGGPLAGRVADSIGRKKTAVTCALFMAGAMLWLTWSTDIWMFYLFAIVFGFFFGGLTPPLAALIGDIFGLRHFGALIGATSVAWGIGAAVGPTLTGYIFDIYGSYVTAFLAGMAAMLIIAVLVLLTRRPTGKVSKTI